MPRTDIDLPRPHGRPFITDGGLETTLVFHEGLDLPFFAAFPLALNEEGRSTLARYFAPYLAQAAAHGAGLILDTPTWRANPDWAARLGFGLEALREANIGAARFAAELRERHAGLSIVPNGVLGPRGDGYAVGETMTVPEAAAYHGPQMEAFREAGLPLASAITMTYAAEGTGIALAGRERGLPVAISFTVETDGRLPSGETLEQAITAVDAATDGYPAYYMINCAHPDHFAHVFASGGAWRQRIAGVRANASRKSHAELDAATELDNGDPAELGRDVRKLRRSLPGLSVFGGCCGTDHRHIAAICEACL